MQAPEERGAVLLHAWLTPLCVRAHLFALVALVSHFQDNNRLNFVCMDQDPVFARESSVLLYHMCRQFPRNQDSVSQIRVKLIYVSKKAWYACTAVSTQALHAANLFKGPCRTSFSKILTVNSFYASFYVGPSQTNTGCRTIVSIAVKLVSQIVLVGIY